MSFIVHIRHLELRRWYEHSNSLSWIKFEGVYFPTVFPFISSLSIKCLQSSEVSIT